ncbi:MAG: V-type ATP synthase subunit D [Chloroflexota bacterium]|nr:MAG: V-type ATP synthase subunit D [Chloroflexota bacterium]
MPGERVPATRMNLLEARRSLDFAREGYDLLDRKRQVLIGEATRLIEDAQDVRRRLDTAFAEAYRVLAVARMMVHSERVEWAALAADRGADVRIVERSVMGVVIPIVELTRIESRIEYGPLETGASLDRAVRAFEALLQIVAQAAETETAAWRLAREIRKTQRRVNALSAIFIPKYETMIATIEAALEEKEREAFFRSKMVKRKRQERGEI